jgi:hypothetical protein
MRTRQIKSQADVERYIAKGFGAGERENYIPWIRVQDISSRGRSRKVQGTKADRVHHLLSDLEYWYWLTLEFSEQVVDIREQFPLFPTPGDFKLAATLGIDYPRYPQTSVPFVMTTDFMITLKGPDGKLRHAGRTLKYQEELEKSKGLQRRLEKFELEKAMLESRGITDWGIVTDEIIGKKLATNLQWLRKGAHPERHHLNTGLRTAYKEHLAYYCSPERTLSSVIRSAASAISLPYTDGVVIFRHLVWSKEVLVNLREQVLSLSESCPAFAFPAHVTKMVA